MNYLLFFLQTETTDWLQYTNNGVVFLLVVVILYFLRKALWAILPVWKEIQIERIKVRDKESESLGQLGIALGQLSTSLTQVSVVTNQIAVEQRKATENVLILQRVSADQSSHLAEAVDTLGERMETLEKKLNC